MDEVRRRIKEVLELKGIKANSLAKKGSPEQRKIQRQINEGSDITIDTLLIIINNIGDLDLDWLLRGVGTSPFGTLQTRINYAISILNSIDPNKDRK